MMIQASMQNVVDRANAVSEGSAGASREARDRARDGQVDEKERALEEKAKQIEDSFLGGLISAGTMVAGAVLGTAFTVITAGAATPLVVAGTTLLTPAGETAMLFGVGAGVVGGVGAFGSADRGRAAGEHEILAGHHDLAAEQRAASAEDAGDRARQERQAIAARGEMLAEIDRKRMEIAERAIA